VVPEAYGGDTMFVPVSAKKGTGIDELLEAILLQAEVLELTAPKDSHGQGPDHRGPPGQGSWPGGHAAGPVRYAAARRRAARRCHLRSCPCDAGRERQAHRRSRPVHPGRDPRPVRRAGCRRRGVALADERKAREIALFRQGKFRDVKLAKQQAAKLESMFEQMGPRARSRPCRSSSRPTCRVPRKRWPSRWSSCPPTKSGCRSSTAGRRDQRVRRQPGAGLRRGHHRLQHPCRCQCPQAGRDLRCRYPLLQHHLRRRR
jgi:hypothetical protein